MALGNVQYTLVGFSVELDWRPLCFVKPLPPKMVCGACGLVRPKTVLLSCLHVLCGSCYEQCGQEGLHVCPVDNYESQDDDVEWRELAADDLLKKEVKCWNEASGCQHIVAASGIVQHFRLECAHHFVCCPKCPATVPRCYIITHLKSGLCTSRKPFRADFKAEPGVTDDPASSLRDTLETKVKECFEQIVVYIRSHGDRLDEMCQVINAMKETVSETIAHERGQLSTRTTQTVTDMNVSNEELKSALTTRIDGFNIPGIINNVGKLLKEEAAPTQSDTKDSLFEIATTIRSLKHLADETKENSKKTLDLVTKVRRHVCLRRSLCVFFVRNVKSLQEETVKAGKAIFNAERVFLFGYNIIPGIMLIKHEESVKLHCTIQLRKGVMDEILSWPFEHMIKLSITHPAKKDLVIREVGWRSDKSFQKPTKEHNKFFCFGNETLDLSKLFTDGYVGDDQLRVKYEILP